MDEVMFCINCGARREPGMRFCMECGIMFLDADATSIDTSTEPVQETPVPSPAVPPADAPTLVAEPIAAAGTNGVGVVLPVTGSGTPGTCGARRRGGLIAAIVALVVVLIAVAAFGVWWFVLRDAGMPAGASKQMVSSQTSGGDDSSAADDAAKDTAADKKDKAVVEQCVAAPDASLASTSPSGTTLVADISLTSDDCRSGSFETDDVRVTIDDGDGTVVADAVYDFSDSPITFDSGQAKVKLAFSVTQYWRPYDQIVVSSATVTFETDAQSNSTPAAGAGGALSGANVSDDDIERHAQFALSWQRKHDRTAASGFYTTYTTQLSSKKYGMQVEGKTWRYRDIYEQFLEKRAQYPKALLVWSGDHPTYQKNGTTDYYVILSGEGFSTVDGAKGWCSSNGYAIDDCLPVNLQ